MSLLGIDVGTTGCKAALFTEEGQLMASAYEEYDIEHPRPGWAQLDAVTVWEKVKKTIRKTTLAAANDPIKALSVSSLGEAMVPVTKDGRVLGPSLLNFDARGEQYLTELRPKMTNQHLYRINGNTLGNHFSLTKLMWIRDHQPELYERADKFLLWSSFISFMLGGERCVDFSLANRTLLFDLDSKTWSTELLHLSEIDGRKIPDPVPSGTIIGTVAPKVAEELGLPAQAHIVAGAHDQCANAVGSGVISPGQGMFGMGTFFCAVPVFSQRRDSETMIKRGLNTEHHAVPGLFVSFIYNQGGSLVKWYRNTFAASEHAQARRAGKDIYPELIAEIPPSPSNVIVLPHFAPTGPPDFITETSGIMAGLKLDTTRGEILKGILEGITFYLKECLDTLPSAGIEIKDYRAVGGGSKSHTWVQLCADILGCPFTRLQIKEAGALGAAIIAAIGCGVFHSFDEGVMGMVKLEKTFEPDPRLHQRYLNRYDDYRRLYPSLRGYLKELAHQK